MIALLILAIGGIFMLVMRLMKSTDAYDKAMIEARANPELRKTLGEPIEDGFFPQGNISIDGSSGQADRTIPLNGPNGDAKLYIIAEKRAGEWRFISVP